MINMEFWGSSWEISRLLQRIPGDDNLINIGLFSGLIRVAIRVKCLGYRGLGFRDTATARFLPLED